MQTVEMPQIKGVSMGLYALAQDRYEVSVTAKGCVHKIVVMRGFIFDGASIPRLLWRVCGHPFEVPRVAAGLVHDWLYSARVTTRAEADAIYRALLVAVGWSSLFAWVEWLALRVCGFVAWRSHGRRDRDRARILGYHAKKPLADDDHPLCRVIVSSFLIGFAVAAAFALCGCATKSRSVKLAGMYASESGQLAIGKIEVQAIPEGVDAALIKYSEDNAWLSPSMKLHEIGITLTGTNSVAKADSIVKHICKAFVEAVPKTEGEARPDAPEKESP